MPDSPMGQTETSARGESAWEREVRDECESAAETYRLRAIAEQRKNRVFGVDVVERYTARVEAASQEEALAVWRNGALDLVLVDEEVSHVWEVQP